MDITYKMICALWVLYLIAFNIKIKMCVLNVKMEIIYKEESVQKAFQYHIVTSTNRML